MQALRLERHGLAVEYAPGIDRFVYFGRESGHAGDGVLHTVALGPEPASDGSYTFFGGAYTWVAPQKGSASVPGWADPTGAPRDWPPDPAMDTGPTSVISQSLSGFVTMGPVQRNGLRERKSFRIIDERTAELCFTLVNTGVAPRAGGPWVNTAACVRDADVLAFRITPGTPIRGAMGDDALGKFQSVATPATASGWVVLPLAEAKWSDGIKVYIDTPAGSPAESGPEIAVWHKGWWFHRRVTTWSAGAGAGLTAAGEGPVACYINPGLGIVEAELYAPIADIAPGAETTGIERWTLIPCASPDAGKLPH